MCCYVPFCVTVSSARPPPMEEMPGLLSRSASLEGVSDVEMVMLWDSEENEKEVAKEEEEVEKEEKEEEEERVICFSGE